MRLAPIAFLSELIAGALYTSVITIPISLSMMSVLVEDANIFLVAAIGGVGAVVADSIILEVVRQAESAANLKPRFVKFRRRKIGRWLVVILGALALASPVPDEIAMGILGITKLSWRTFIFIVYPIKTLGILGLLFGLQSIT
jgi:hypothetical protein